MVDGDEKEQLLCSMLIEKVVRSGFIPLSNLSKRSLFPYTLFALGRSDGLCSVLGKSRKPFQYVIL